MSGSTNYGLIENAITHPANGLFIAPGYTVGTFAGFAAATPIPAGTSLL